MNLSKSQPPQKIDYQNAKLVHSDLEESHSSQLTMIAENFVQDNVPRDETAILRNKLSSTGADVKEILEQGIPSYEGGLIFYGEEAYEDLERCMVNFGRYLVSLGFCGLVDRKHFRIVFVGTKIVEFTLNISDFAAFYAKTVENGLFDYVVFHYSGPKISHPAPIAESAPEIPSAPEPVPEPIVELAPVLVRTPTNPTSFPSFIASMFMTFIMFMVVALLYQTRVG